MTRVSGWIHKAGGSLFEVAAALVGISLLTTYSAAEAAFTLIELSIVLVILSLLAGVLLGKSGQDTRRAQAVNVQKQFDKIEGALQRFVKLNNRLPLPADGTKLRDRDSNFGVEVAKAPLANFNDGADTVGGVLPVRTLAPYGLVDDDILDAWNHELGYFVSIKASVPKAFIKYKGTLAGDIHVQDGAGAGSYRTQTALALILSYGASGHGAYQLSGVRKSANITNPDALLDCHCDSNGAATAFNNTFSLHAPSVSTADIHDRFDMVGRYMPPAFFSSPASDSVPDSHPDVAPDSPPDSLPDPTPTPTPAPT